MRPTAFVLAPQLVEIQTLLAGFEQLGYGPQAKTAGRMEIWEIPPLQILLAVAGHGKAQFALQTQYVLDRHAVEGVICVGGAGALDPRLRVGDIVVGVETVEHDYCVRFIECDLPVFVADKLFVSQLQLASQNMQADCSRWFDRIASGDEDIVDPPRANELREHTSAVCVAWEGSGAARAAAFNGLPFVEIRGITDAANEAAGSDYHQNLRLVMPRIAELLHNWRTAT